MLATESLYIMFDLKRMKNEKKKKKCGEVNIFYNIIG